MDSMNNDAEDCAECGHHLAAGYETEPHNADLDRYARAYRPYFCSEECAEKAAGISRIKAELDAEIKRFDGWMWEALENESLSPAYYQHKSTLQRLEAERPRVLQEKSERAYTQYFRNYSNAAYAKRKAQSDKETAALEKQMAREQEKAEAKAARQAEIDRKAAEKKAEADRKAKAEADRLRPIPFEMPPDHSRYEGVHVLGPSGSGKTTLLQEFLIYDLVRDDDPSLIVVDPKGTLTDRIKALKAVDPRRLVIIDATSKYPAKLGLFAGGNDEQLINQAVSTYKYVLEAANFKFTPKQGILFDYAVRVMFEIGGTISGLIDFLRDPTRVQIQNKDVRDFFAHDFTVSYKSTADEIAVRLQQIKQKPILRTMFDTTERHVDFFDCIQNGKIVLVNSGMSLDPDTSRMIGRFVIAMALNAVYVRATMPKSTWRPTFLMCDEFQEFVDAAKTPELLRFPREYNFGSMILHHNMYAAELDQAIRVAISTNTGIKYCADPRGDDLNYMARDLHTDPAFLRAQQVSKTDVHFAHTMRRKYNEAVSIYIPRGNFDDYDMRNPSEIAQLDYDNAAKFHFGPKTVYVSEDEWIDLAQSGYIDDDGKMPDVNRIYKIDKNIQRYHVGSAVITRPAQPIPASEPTKIISDDGWG